MAANQLNIYSSNHQNFPPLYALRFETSVRLVGERGTGPKQIVYLVVKQKLL